MDGRIDDLVELVDDALLLVRIEFVEVGLCVRGEFPSPLALTHPRR